MQHPPKKQFRKRSRRWMAAGMAAALVIAVAFGLWLVPMLRQRYPAASAPLEIIHPDFRTLEMRPAEELESVTLHPQGAESYTLRMQDGTLYLEADGGLQDINDMYAQELLEVFTSFVAQETVAQDAADVQEHLADMGLAPARASAVIRYQDGSETLLEVGAAVPNTTYAYYRWSGDPGIYMCDVGIAEAFALTANHLLPVEQPAVHASLVEKVHLTNAKGENRFVFENGSQGSLMEPFVYPLSAEGTEQLLSALQNFRLGTREAVITEANRAAYGFDAPLCTVEMHQKAGMINLIGADGALETAEVPAQSFRFVIGRAEGEYFYTCEYEGSCYLMSRFLVETLVKAEREDLLSRNPANLGDALLASAVIRAPGGELAVDVLRAERVLPNNQLELDENGQPVYDTLVAINGQEGTQEQLDVLTDRLWNLAVSGEIPETFVLSSDAEPRWSIMLETAAGETRRIDAYRMDAFSDALSVDGVMKHYVHSDVIDVIVAGFL